MFERLCIAVKEMSHKSDLSEEAAVETRLDGVTNWCSAVIPGNKQFDEKSSKCTGCFFNWYPPKSSKYKKVNLG